MWYSYINQEQLNSSRLDVQCPYKEQLTAYAQEIPPTRSENKTKIYHLKVIEKLGEIYLYHSSTTIPREYILRKKIFESE